MKTPHPVFDPDAPPTAEEQAQAEALAQALEPGAASSPPELAEPLATAALLRQSAHAPLPEHVLAEVLAALPARQPRRWWLWPAIAVPIAASVLFLAAGSLSMRASRAPAVAVVPRPVPPLPLLRAQAEVARGDSKALATLDAEMRTYRARFYGSQGRR
jgi:hypothetical protein